MARNGSVLDDDSLDSPVDFVAAWAEHERRGAQLALAARRLEQSGEWATDGSVSLISWLRHDCRRGNRDAGSFGSRGRFLGAFEDIATAAVDGVLSAGQVQPLGNGTPSAV